MFHPFIVELNSKLLPNFSYDYNLYFARKHKLIGLCVKNEFARRKLFLRVFFLRYSLLGIFLAFVNL